MCNHAIPTNDALRRFNAARERVLSWRGKRECDK